jgi:hypothetical protein
MEEIYGAFLVLATQLCISYIRIIKKVDSTERVFISSGLQIRCPEHR